jgi:hypothetical protein
MRGNLRQGEIAQLRNTAPAVTVLTFSRLILSAAIGNSVAVHKKSRQGYKKIREKKGESDRRRDCTVGVKGSMLIALFLTRTTT